MGGGFLEEMNNMNRDYLVSRKNPMDGGAKAEEEINDCCRKEESSKHLYETFSNPIDLDVMEDYFNFMNQQIDCCRPVVDSDMRRKEESSNHSYTTFSEPIDLDVMEDYYKYTSLQID